ncbi:ABC transporter permease [Actinoplanes awajinensis]|uniref:ABC transporter permease n=1 Tax=Actinoplanes awajinensis subsp. mycoplanecinus TaxID=135947 RepID=A0A117MKJ5_9ACTN|nr:ABC transporter permease [Actinoplanes awajinensis]KUL22420.1 ABC transporter permease [Actinoplanes awajinensis subsp. mycoplanecinus]
MTTVAAPPRFNTGRLKDVSFWAEWAAAIGLVLLVIVFQILNPTFLSTGNIASMLVAAAILVILAVGQTFVVATGGIDLSVASMMTLGAVGFGQAYSHGWGLTWSCLVAVAVGAATGLINGLVIAKGRITDFIVTLGMLSAASGAALILADGKPVTVIDTTLLQLSTGGIGVFGWTVLIAAVVAIIAHVLVFWTRFGTHVLATGGSREAANATGINTDRIKIAVYAVSGLLAGLAAILLVARVGAAEPASNTSFLLNSVAAVVLGGVSLLGGWATIAGPVIGALLLTALTNGLTLLGVSQFYQPLAVGFVVVLAALLTRFQK